MPAFRLWLASLMLTLSAPGAAQYRLPQQNLSPHDVVSTQLQALQAGEDADLAVVFAFASPGNRAQTGPVERFIAMVRSTFPEMLRHQRAELSPTVQRGPDALVPVRLVAADGTEHHYLFILGRYQIPRCGPCWMTDGVLPPDAFAPDTAAPPEQTL